MDTEQLEILKMLEASQIDAEEAALLLAALDETEAEHPADLPAGVPAGAWDGVPNPTETAGDMLPSRSKPSESPENRWARFWIYPMMGGAVVLILGVLVVGLVYATDGAKGWLLCGWLPMLLGLTIVLLALWSRRTTWMHLRISEQDQRKIAFSFPLPLSLTAWTVRIAQPFVPQLRETGVDDLILALRDSASHGEPLFIDVQDEQDGERVEIYIG